MCVRSGLCYSGLICGGRVRSGVGSTRLIRNACFQSRGSSRSIAYLWSALHKLALSSHTSGAYPREEAAPELELSIESVAVSRICLLLLISTF